MESRQATPSRTSLPGSAQASAEAVPFGVPIISDFWELRVETLLFCTFPWPRPHRETSAISLGCLDILR